MAEQFLFLSYKRGPQTTPIAERLHDRIGVQLGDIPVESFFDAKSIDAGEEWEPAIDTFLAKANFFVAFVSIDYWLSKQCMRELRIAVAQYERERRPRLLFILADQLEPSDLAFDAKSAAGRADAKMVEAASEEVRKVKNLGQINFLGPYDTGASLVRLPVEDFAASDRHLAAMVKKIRTLTGRPSSGERG